jgi:hypothetical protein
MQARLLHLDQVRLPPTQEIASENVFLVARSLGIADMEAAALLDLLLMLDSLPLFCPCAFASDRRACLRRLQLSRLRYRPRARARRRQRHSGSSCERGPPGDDDGGDGDGPAGRPHHEPAGVS